jgi:UDP-N-acetylmuramoyl-L-alanyl-D-glutamate--2,6-diaminopimelate ligase
VIREAKGRGGVRAGTAEDMADTPTIGALAARIGIDAGTFAPVPLAGITADHRKVKPGFAFFALPGTKVDGQQFVAAAADAGAVVCFGAGARPPTMALTSGYFRIDNPRRALALAASVMHPAQPATIVAVTGTAGKTSVADFARQIFAACGHRAASLGTLGVIGPEGAEYGALTTPDPVTLHATIDDLARRGVTHLAMEASSHGLDQARLDGVKLSAAAFTNLGRDHLDYHPTMEEYFKAKLRLFEVLLPTAKPAIINLDGDRGAEAAIAAAFAGHPVITVGRNAEDIQLLDLMPFGFGQKITIWHAGKNYEIDLPLMGAFQVQNALVAAALVLATGEKPKKVFAALGKLKGVPGRLEQVGVANGAPIFVDYAHKPEALEHALAALRPGTTGRLVVVFGCGGDRDPGKRPIMGRIAHDRADLVIVTDDNPRSETPSAIRAAILAAAPGAIEIGDREAAIHEAVRHLQPGDALLVAGKGHETGQIVGNETRPFSDHAVAAAAIAESLGAWAGKKPEADAKASAKSGKGQPAA